MTRRRTDGTRGRRRRLTLIACFFLDDDDLELVGRHRGEHMRAGFALQLTTVRWLGTFLEDPLDVPGEVLDFIAGQLGMADPSQVKRYTERDKTRFDHQWEIRRTRGYREFADAEAEFSGWVAARSRATRDGPKAIFADGLAWLRERKVLLPGVTTLAQLVASGTARDLLQARAGGPARPERRADKRRRRLRPAEHLRPREDRPGQDPPQLGGHPAGRRLHLHRRRPGLRRRDDAAARRSPDRARRGDSDVRADLQVAAHPQLHRHRRDLPARHQGHPQPAGRPPRPGTQDLPREEGRAVPPLRAGPGEPARRPRPRLELRHPLDDRPPRRRCPTAQGPGLPGARGGYGSPVPVRQPAPGRPRHLQLCPSGPGPGAIRDLRDPDATDEDDE
jgi:hypothetical protein